MFLYCRHIRHVSGSGAPLAVPLRMLELFTDPNSYSPHIADDTAAHIIQDVMSFLLRKGRHAGFTSKT